jgi:hypothetical protein
VTHHPSCVTLRDSLFAQALACSCPTGWPRREAGVLADTRGLTRTTFAEALRQYPALAFLGCPAQLVWRNRQWWLA